MNNGELSRMRIRRWRARTNKCEPSRTGFNRLGKRAVVSSALKGFIYNIIHYVLCVAGRRADGRLRVEWYTTGPGVTRLPKWVDAHINPQVRAVVVDERGALAELDWAGAKIGPTFIGHREGRWLQACSGMRSLTARWRIAARWSCRAAVLSAKQRPMLGGQAFGWDRKTPGSSVLVAVSLALWGVDCERPARPRRGSGSRRVVVL